MKKSKISNKGNGALSVSKDVAEGLPHRALLLLRAVGTIPVVTEALASCGFTAADQEQGWTLLRKTTSNPSVVVGQVAATPGQVATEELSEWCGPAFVRAHAALRHRHPEQEEFLFSGLTAGKGPDAVLAVLTFLDRCEALNSSVSRTGTREADAAALQTLEKRGLGVAERNRVAKLVTTVSTQALPEVPKMDQDEDARDEAMYELYAWVHEWSETARAVISRRDLLLRMGIGKRKSSTPPPPVVEPAHGTGTIVVNNPYVGLGE